MKCRKDNSSLLILLDRAEDVPYLSLGVVFSLFDQSNPFLTVVASRPGILIPMNPLSSSAIIPNDHYDIHHLGASPYSSKWREYAFDVLSAWFPNAISRSHREEFDLVLNLSRDSFRTAFELVYNSIEESSGTFSEKEFFEFIQIKQDVLLRAAQGHLRHLNARLQDLITEIRRETKPFKLPILLELPDRRKRNLQLFNNFRELSGEEMFVQLALRSGFFTTTHGRNWHPYAEIFEVEIPPIFIWERGDQWNDIVITG